jgi:ribosomal-protein-alanine N-acetyltransferase
MRLSDISQVTGIERRAFSSPWTARTYAYEIEESDYSYMMVLTVPDVVPRNDMISRITRLLGYTPNTNETVVAYGGLWHLYDEAHISTIASNPDYRRKGYGEAALVGMIQRAVTLGAAYVALEVRVSNLNAQALYLKHGFQIAGIKPRYYSDNGENAYDMRLPLTDGNCQRAIETFKALCQTMSIEDSYTGFPSHQ